jgi:hypothetical protein
MLWEPAPRPDPGGGKAIVRRLSTPYIGLVDHRTEASLGNSLHRRLGELCIGCGRTLDEIAGWADMSAEERRAIMALLPARKALNETVKG